MTAETCRLKLLCDWGGYTKGHEFPEMPAGQARTMQANRLGEIMEGKAAEAPLNRAIGARGGKGGRVTK